MQRDGDAAPVRAILSVAPGPALVLIALLAGCAPALQQKQRARALMVTSDTPGARVLLDHEEVGRTPATVKIRYVEVLERITERPSMGPWYRKVPWYLGLLGGVALVGGGGALTVLGVTYADDMQPGVAQLLVSTGIVAAVSGITAAGWGVYRVVKEDDVVERQSTRPVGVTVSVGLPGGGLVHTRISLGEDGPSPRLEEVGRLHLFEGLERIQSCRIRISTTPAGVKVVVPRADDQPLLLGVTPLELSCRVRRRTPAVGLHSRSGRRLYRPSYALQITDPRLGGHGTPWRSGRPRLPLLVETGELRVPLMVILSAAKVWQGPRVDVSGRVLLGRRARVEARVSYGSAPASQPAR